MVENSPVQCAWAAKRAKASYYKAQFFRLKARRGPQKAICAVASSILTAIYHMPRNGTFHRDLGAAYFDKMAPEAKANRLARQIISLEYRVTIQGPKPRETRKATSKFLRAKRGSKKRILLIKAPVYVLCLFLARGYLCPVPPKPRRCPPHVPICRSQRAERERRIVQGRRMGCGLLLRSKSVCTTVTANLRRSIPAFHTPSGPPPVGSTTSVNVVAPLPRQPSCRVVSGSAPARRSTGRLENLF